MRHGSRKARLARLAVCLLATIGLLLPTSALAGKKTVDIDFSGEYRIRPQGDFDRDLDSDRDDKRYPVLQRVRFGIGIEPTEQVRLFFQIQDSRAFGDELSTVANSANVDLHQGYALIRATDSFRLTAGRQEWKYGDERMIGALNWANVGRAFDGVLGRGEFAQGWIDGFWGRLARFTEQDENERGRDLFGLYSHFWIGEKGAIEPYLLVWRTGHEMASEIPDEFDNSNVVAFGARALGKFGSTRLSGEFAFETGSIGGDDLSAAAVGLEASHKFGDEDFWWKPVGGFDYATGDEDPTDGERGEFFNFFPTNHKHYGYIDFFGWRNIVSPWGGVAFGGDGHTLLVKFHGFWLDKERGRWSSATGATLGFDPDGESGKHVGNEIDITWKKKVYEVVALLAGFSRFNPGEFADATRGEDPAHRVYLQATVGF